MAGRPSYLPINGTRGSKAIITTLMTPGRTLHSLTPELDVAVREGSNQPSRDGCQ